MDEQKKFGLAKNNINKDGCLVKINLTPKNKIVCLKNL